MTLHEFFNEVSARAFEKAQLVTNRHKISIFITNSIASTLISFVLIIGISQLIEMSSLMQIVLVGCLGFLILNMLPHALLPSAFADEAAIELYNELDESTQATLHKEAINLLEDLPKDNTEVFNKQLVAIDFLLKEVTARNVNR